MILSGKEIKEKIGKEIVIEPYDERRVNPNSYNLRLHHELLVYEEPVLDMKRENRTRKLVIPEEGLVLEPGRLYLGRTMEYTRTEGYVPMLEGRSSIGRLGMFIHVTAGFGDVGFSGYWTLEIFCIQPLRIYPGVEICQIYYHTIEGEYEKYSSGKYQNNIGIQPSLLYREFQGEGNPKRKPLIEVREKNSSDQVWISENVRKNWGSEKIVTRNRIHHSGELPGLIAIHQGKPAGLLLYNIQGSECEIVLLESYFEKIGIGTTLIEAIKARVKNLGCSRLWLITTNDNLKALRFYQLRGFQLSALYPNAISDSRKLKPEIPLIGNEGIPIRDEIELSLELK